MTAAIDVASAEDIQEGVPTLVVADGRELVLIRWRGEIFAIRNVCPHQTQSFVDGYVSDRIVGTMVPGEIVVGAHDPVLACPWHTFRFNLRDGRCTGDRSLRVRTYNVSVRDGRVLISLE